MVRYSQPRLFSRNPLQQFRRRFVSWVLFYQLPPHGKVQHEAPQPGDGVWRFGYAVIEGKQAGGVHRTSASVKIPFSRSRNDATSASAFISSSSSLSGSP